MRNCIIILCFLSASFSQVFSHYDYTGSRATSMSGAVTSGPGSLDNIFPVSYTHLTLPTSDLV